MKHAEVERFLHIVDQNAEVFKEVRTAMETTESGKVAHAIAEVAGRHGCTFSAKDWDLAVSN